MNAWLNSWNVIPTTRATAMPAICAALKSRKSIGPSGQPRQQIAQQRDQALSADLAHLDDLVVGRSGLYVIGRLVRDQAEAKDARPRVASHDRLVRGAHPDGIRAEAAQQAHLGARL